MSISNDTAAQLGRKSHDNRINVLVLGVAVIAAAMLVGMLFDVPGLILYSSPLLIFIFMLMGGTNRNGSYKGVFGGILVYAIVLGILFVLMGVLQTSDAVWFGLPLSSGILVYIIWPFATITAGCPVSAHRGHTIS